MMRLNRIWLYTPDGREVKRTTGKHGAITSTAAIAAPCHLSKLSTNDNSARDFGRFPRRPHSIIINTHFYGQTTTVPRVIAPGIKNPATDQLLLDGLLTGAMPDDHASKLKIAVKCGDHLGEDLD